MGVSPPSPSSLVNVCPSSLSDSNDSELVPSPQNSSLEYFVPQMSTAVVGVSGRRHGARGRGLGRAVRDRECGVRGKGGGRGERERFGMFAFVLFLFIACEGLYPVVVCSVLFGPVVVCPWCYREIEISVHNIELAPT